MSVKTYSLKIDGKKKLSDNFTVSEFRCKDGSDKILIDTDLVNILQKVREHFNKPVTINSAYRNATYNQKIGGASRSQHVYGTASDIVVKDTKPEDVAKYVEFLMPQKGGIGLYSTFTHVDVRAVRARWKNFGSEISVAGFPGYKEPTIVNKDESKSFTYHIEGTTHIIEVDPLKLGAYIADKRGDQINIANFVNGGYFMNQADGTTFCQHHLVDCGKILSNCATHGKPVTTLCVFYDGVVQVKKISDISLERGLKFAISGASLTDYQSEGFVGEYSDIARSTNRTYIGYRKSDNKIVICVRPNTSIARAAETFKNLGVDAGITLDGGGSTCMRVNGDWKVKTTRQINSIIMWE